MDSLIAQLMAADESLAHKNEEITKLKKELATAVASFQKAKDMLPILKHQVTF